MEKLVFLEMKIISISFLINLLVSFIALGIILVYIFMKSSHKGRKKNELIKKLF